MFWILIYLALAAFFTGLFILSDWLIVDKGAIKIRDKVYQLWDRVLSE